MIPFLKRFAKDDSGSTAMEYAIIAAMLSVFTVTAVAALGQKVLLKWQTVQTALN